MDWTHWPIVALLTCLILLPNVCTTATPKRWIVRLDPNKVSRTFTTEEHCHSIGETFRFCIVDHDNDQVIGGPAALMSSLAQDDAVLSVEPDQEFKALFCQQQAPWHLSHLQQFQPNAQPNVFTSDDTMQGPVPIYIVDTWMDVKHPEFRGRALVGYQGSTGYNTHGTHVAGLTTSVTYGSQKQGLLVSVVVLGGNGSGSYSLLLQGLAWISKKTKGVVNISIGGPPSAAVNDAVDALWDAGFVVVVAAGNESRDACQTSPAGARKVITVGATNRQNRMASFSNYGPCVDILAPGEQVVSTLPNGQSGAMSGTSMASPVVAGLLSLHVRQRGLRSPNEHREWLLKHASRDKISGVPAGTPNLFAQQPTTALCATCAPINSTLDTLSLFSSEVFTHV